MNVAQFIGGAYGDKVQQFLQTTGVTQVTERLDDSTRVCTTILDRREHDMVELVEPSPPVPVERKVSLEAQMLSVAARAGGVAIMGTAPKECGSLYTAVAAACAPTTVLLLDGCNDVEDLLKLERVSILKINAVELRTLCSRLRLTLPPSPTVAAPVVAAPVTAASVVAASGGPTEAAATASPVEDITAHGYYADIVASARKLSAHFRIPYVAVTDGPNTAVLVALVHEGFHWEIMPPLLDPSRVLNTIGAGDTVAGVLLSFLARCDMGNADQVAKALGAALAAGSASCTNLKGAVFTEASMYAMLANVNVSKVMRSPSA